MADDFGMGYALGADSGGNNNGGGFGNFGEGIWAVIILAILFGRGGLGGFGGFGGGGGGGDCCCNRTPCATQADVRAAVDQQTLISKLDQQTYGLADSTYALNNTITNGFHGVDNAICNLGFNVQTGFNGLSAQLATCCCDTQRAIDGVNYNMATQLCALGNAINTQTRDLIDNQNANYRSIMDFMVTEKLAAKDAQIAALQGQLGRAEDRSYWAANQEAQTAELIRRLGRDCPVPAYVVPNPNCCYGNPVGIGYGNNGGCGCGC